MFSPVSGSSQQPVLDLEPLDAKFIDEAVEATLKNFDLQDGTSGLLKDLLSRDSNSAVATSYFDDYNAKGLARSVNKGRKPRLFVDYVLTDVQVSTLLEYAPEYDLVFRNLDLHDHPMAAAMRMIDHAIINSRIPVMARVCDVGGDVLYHIRKGNVNVHCCNPDIDAKDDARSTMRRLAIRNMQRHSKSYTNSTQEMLSSYLSNDIKHFCRSKAQDCCVVSDVGTSVHVYDVPMADWPRIMANKGLSLVEGSMLFSDKFFDRSQGELIDSGVRYEIDAQADLFKMGFCGSPSWWYVHKWSQFVLYGIDQRIVYGDSVYSYKIVERRADTIFFRIIAVPARPNESSPDVNVRHYRYPGVRMVNVNGFDFSSDFEQNPKGLLQRRSMLVAAPLWEALVNVASMEYERNALDFNKMFNAYRTIAPRHTINGVLVSGGYSVDVEEMKVVVIHAAIAGACRAMIAETTNRALTADVFKQRNRLQQSTGNKLLEFLGDSLKLVAGYPFQLAVVQKLIEFFSVRNRINEPLELITDIYEPNIKTISCDKILVRPSKNLTAQAPHFGFRNLSAASMIHDLLAAAEKEPRMAKVFYEDFYGQLNEEQKVRLEVSIKRLGTSVSGPEESAADTGRVTNVVSDQQDHSTIDPAVTDTTEHGERVLAIQEAITEILLEQEITHSLCRRIYSHVVLGSKVVNRVALNRDKEADGNPDLWYVSNGVLSNVSCNKVPIRDFCHSRVYVGNSRESPILKVTAHTWYNERDGTTEVNYMLDNSQFTGYVLTCDSLLVYNGEEILDSLRSALRMDHSSYRVVLHEGPPGCGKTHSIIHSYQSTDMVMCPVKQSMDDTKLRLIEEYGSVIKSRDCGRTVDSLLMHGIRSAVVFDRILADECFMTHAGKWYACAAILGVSRIEAYGDTKQIPHIPRVQCPKDRVVLRCDSRTFNPITRRCPADSVAAWCHMYDGKVRTVNEIENSICESSNFSGQRPTKHTCLMGMYQADKKEIRKLYPNHEALAGKSMVVTTHESEGKTYKEVILFRFDRRVRKDTLSLYDRDPYVLVALSRHTTKFTYVRADGLNDLVSRLICNARDPCSVKAMFQSDRDPNG